MPLAWFEGYAQCLAWTDALPDGSCGPNLEYSNEFLELQSASAGRAENQFQSAEEPDWKLVQRLSESLLGRTRDLRILVIWLTAQLHLNGLAGLLPALALMNHWCQHHWGSLNPPLDDEDPFERLNAIEVLAQGELFLAAFKRTEVISLPMIGAVQIRHFAYAMDKASPLNSSDHIPRSQLESALQMQAAKSANIRAVIQDIRTGLDGLAQVLSTQLPDQVLPDFQAISDLLNNVLMLLPRTVPNALKTVVSEGAAGTDGSEGSGSSSVMSSNGEMSGVINSAIATGMVQSRQDAIRFIEAVCRYLEQAEPTNPAQLLLKRATKLIDKNFLALMKDLAPGALNDVARIMGVDPKEIPGSD